jgi:hypothetical protein
MPWWARRKFVGGLRPPGQASHPVAAQGARLGVGTDYEDWQVLGWLSADPGLCATITGPHVRVLVVLMARSTPDTRAAIATVSGVTTRNGAPGRPSPAGLPTLTATWHCTDAGPWHAGDAAISTVTGTGSPALRSRAFFIPAKRVKSMNIDVSVI